MLNSVLGCVSAHINDIRAKRFMKYRLNAAINMMIGRQTATWKKIRLLSFFLCAFIRWWKENIKRILYEDKASYSMSHYNMSRYVTASYPDGKLCAAWFHQVRAADARV